MKSYLLFKNNPFYILGVTPKDKVRDLEEIFIKAATDVSTLNVTKLREAQQVLSFSEFRLNAQLTWVGELDRKELSNVVAKYKVPLSDDLSLLSKANILTNRYATNAIMKAGAYEDLFKNWLSTWKELLNKLDHNPSYKQELLNHYFNYQPQQVLKSLPELYQAQLEIVLPSSERLNQIYALLTPDQADVGADSSLNSAFSTHLIGYSHPLAIDGFKENAERTLVKLEEFWRTLGKDKRERVEREVLDLLGGNNRDLQGLKRTTLPNKEEQVRGVICSYTNQLLKAIELKHVDEVLEESGILMLNRGQQLEIRRGNQNLVWQINAMLNEHFTGCFDPKNALTILAGHDAESALEILRMDFPKIYTLLQQAKTDGVKVFESITINGQKSQSAEGLLNYDQLINHFEKALQVGLWRKENLFKVSRAWFCDFDLSNKNTLLKSTIGLLDLKRLWREHPIEGESDPSFPPLYEAELDQAFAALCLNLLKAYKAGVTTLPKEVVAKLLAEPTLDKNSRRILKRPQLSNGQKAGVYLEEPTWDAVGEQLFNEEEGLDALAPYLFLSFKENPFYILKATPNNSQEELAEKYKMAVAFTDYEDSFKVGQAYQNLSSTIPKFGAELTWCAPLSKDDLRTLLQEPDQPLPQELSALVKANILLNRYLEHPTMADTAYTALFKEWVGAWRVVFENLWGDSLTDIFWLLWRRQLAAIMPIFERFTILDQHWLVEVQSLTSENNPDLTKMLVQIESRGADLMGHYFKTFWESVLAKIEGLWSIVEREVKAEQFNDIQKRLKEWVHIYPIIQQIQKRWWQHALRFAADNLNSNKYIADLLLAIKMDRVKNAPKSLDFLSHEMRVGNSLMLENYKMGELLADFFATHIALTDAEKEAAQEQVKLYALEQSVAAFHKEGTLFYEQFKQTQGDPNQFLTGINEEGAVVGTGSGITLYTLLNALDVALESSRSAKQRALYFNLTRDWFEEVASYSDGNKIKTLIAVRELKKLINKYAMHSNISLGRDAVVYKEALHNVTHRLYADVIKMGIDKAPLLVVDQIFGDPDLAPELEAKIDAWLLTRRDAKKQELLKAKGNPVNKNEKDDHLPFVSWTLVTATVLFCVLVFI